MEVLKAIPGHPLYRAGEDGRIYSLWTDKFLTPVKTPNGYLQVVLTTGRKQCRLGVHRLIAMTFHGTPSDGMVVNHKNGNPADNRADNLEWVTPSQNVQHAYDTGLRQINDAHRQRCADMGRARRSFSDEQASAIRSAYTGARGEITRLAKQHGLSRYAVSTILGA
jgi:hypothetical protein